MGGSSSKPKPKSGFDKFKTMAGWALLLAIIFWPLAGVFIIPLGVIYFILFMIAYFKD